jgi:hypothetical protein
LSSKTTEPKKQREEWQNKALKESYAAISKAAKERIRRMEAEILRVIK